jgi:predicted lipoprotein with Yx(FWY)xxD motif
MTHPADATTTSGRRAPVATTRRKGLLRPRTAVGALAVAAIALAACGSSSPSSTTAASANTGTGAAASPGTTAATTATIKTASSSQFGTILVNGAGMALYTYGPNNGGTTNMCMGACLQAWPAVTVPTGTTPTLASGVAGTLGTAMQSDGTLQVTYNGMLLYTFVSDTSPGQVTGNGVAKFSVAKASSSGSGSGVPAGNTPATTKAPAKAPTTTAAPSGGGYSY